MLWQPASVRLPAFELSALPVQFWLAGRYWPSLTANAAWPAKTATAENTMTRCRMMDSPSSRGGIRKPGEFPPRAVALMVPEARFADRQTQPASHRAGGALICVFAPVDAPD